MMETSEFHDIRLSLKKLEILVRVVRQSKNKLKTWVAGRRIFFQKRIQKKLIFIWQMKLNILHGQKYRKYIEIYIFSLKNWIWIILHELNTKVLSQEWINKPQCIHTMEYCPDRKDQSTDQLNHRWMSKTSCWVKHQSQNVNCVILFAYYSRKWKSIETGKQKNKTKNSLLGFSVKKMSAQASFLGDETTHILSGHYTNPHVLKLKGLCTKKSVWFNV
jgi:hypothetical protein